MSLTPQTHYTLYHDWQQALRFCQTLPDVSPPDNVTFHMLWRERRGLWRRRRRFGRKQALSVKSFLATQDLRRCSLIIWSDRDLSDNEWLRPFRSKIDFRIYDPEREARDTPLESCPHIYRQRDGRVYRDGDLFRILVLHNYGGVYVDMDVVLLRSLGVLLGQEFIYQWDRFDDVYNNAVMHLRRHGTFARELVRGVIEIPAGKYNWGRENLKRAFARGRTVTVFPATFFDPDWQASGSFQPFTRTDTSRELHDGAFAWHWHNCWDSPIQEGSKFHLLEQRVDLQLGVSPRFGRCTGIPRAPGFESIITQGRTHPSPAKPPRGTHERS